MINLREALQEGYAIVDGRCFVPGQPKLYLGELQALIAFCSAEMDRIEETDAEIRNVPDAKQEITEACAELISAFKRIDSACLFIERDKQAGWI